MNIKKTSIITASVMAAIMLVSGISFCEEPPWACGPEMQGSSMMPMLPRTGPHEQGVPLGLMLLNDYIRINVISELTGLTQENVRQLLISSPPPAILDAYGVSLEAFKTAMDKQAAKLVGQAVSSGVITKKQEEELHKKLNRKPKNPREE